MFNLKRFMLALVGVFVLLSSEARAESFVITNVSGVMAVDTDRNQQHVFRHYRRRRKSHGKSDL